MSHVVECKAVLKNLDVIEKAAQRLGGMLHRGQSKARMYASGFVDDSQGWRDFFEPAEADRIARLPKQERVAIINKAMNSFDHVISFGGAKYDVGVAAKADGTFRLRYDEWGSGGLTPIMGPGAGKFMQAYGIEAAKRAAKARGFATKEVTGKNGQVQLEVMVH
jgi:hypothetical protein